MMGVIPLLSTSRSVSPPTTTFRVQVQSQACIPSNGTGSSACMLQDIDDWQCERETTHREATAAQAL